MELSCSFRLLGREEFPFLSPTRFHRLGVYLGTDAYCEIHCADRFTPTGYTSALHLAASLAQSIAAA
jgi:hypothetical protein